MTVKYIRLDKNKVVEVLITDQDIKELFHESLKWDVCTDQRVGQGWIYNAGAWIDPTSVVDTESKAQEERTWRDKELVRADEELNKVQDSDPKATGTVGVWREYRKNLRSLPELEGFPLSHVRPVAPDVA